MESTDCKLFYSLKTKDMLKSLLVHLNSLPMENVKMRIENGLNDTVLSAFKAHVRSFLRSFLSVIKHSIGSHNRSIFIGLLKPSER